MERHDTHTLSLSSLSSDNHSYDFGNKSKKKLIKRNIQNNLKETQLTNLQIKKINTILSKYNIISDKSIKTNTLTKHRESTENKKEEEIILNKNILSSKNFSDNNNNITSNKDRDKEKENKASSKKKSILINKKKKAEKNKKEINNYINKEEIKIEPQKKDGLKKEENKKEEQKVIEPENEEPSKDDTKNNGLRCSISYKDCNRETRFNNIRKFIREENRKSIKLKKKDNSNKLLIYRHVIKSDNLVRTIEKPPISFITKVFKGLNESKISSHHDENIGICLNVTNNLFFITKQIVKNKVYNKKIKILKYRRNNEDNKIPSFSSINTSSSNGLHASKSNSKNKKKITKKITKIKSKNIGIKNKTLNTKNYKSQKSMSLNSKYSKEKNDEGLKSLSKRKKIIPNVKKKQNFISERKLKSVNQNIRKYSISNRYQGKLNNLKKEIHKINENEKLNNNNNNNNIEKNINEKNNNEKNNFKNFLKEQILKRDKKLRDYMKKQGINSYKFFYPKEPSPLLGLFKKQYNIYPTLNIERKNSIDIGNNNNIIINNKHYYKIHHYSHKKGKTLNENDKLKNIYENNNNMKELNHDNNLHLFEKHFGIEQDCPLCRAFQMRKLNNERNKNYIKSMKYKIIKINTIERQVKSPNTFNYINGNDSYFSRNRNNSVRRNEYIDQYSKIKKNLDILFDYFNQ